MPPILERLSSRRASQLIRLIKIVPTEIQTAALNHVRSSAGGGIWKRVACVTERRRFHSTRNG